MSTIEVACKRCGRYQLAEFCLDCRAVDKKMTAGGLTRYDLKERRMAKRKQERDDRLMFYRVAGRNPEAASFR